MSILDVFRGRRTIQPTGTIPPPSSYHEESVALARQERDWYKSKLFEAWIALRGQSKGLQRQRRIINRVRAENAALKAQLARPPVTTLRGVLGETIERPKLEIDLS